ncbi:MAG: 30S ribosomal protein S17 [Candidatus Micrarchaeota archaeon]
MDCTDKNCPVHGTLKTRGAVKTGLVVSAKAKNTVVVVIGYFRKATKYERLEKRTSRIKAHVPPCMNVEEGQLVKIAECRKISKTKAHVVVKIVKKK